MRRRNKYAAFIAAVLFFFFAPVIPANVTIDRLLPLANQCQGLGGYDQVSVMTSISYKVVNLVLRESSGGGALGLVYVQDHRFYTVQFPPLGFDFNLACNQNLA